MGGAVLDRALRDRRARAGRRRGPTRSCRRRRRGRGSRGPVAASPRRSRPSRPGDRRPVVDASRSCTVRSVVATTLEVRETRRRRCSIIAWKAAPSSSLRCSSTPSTSKPEAGGEVLLVAEHHVDVLGEPPVDLARPLAAADRLPQAGAVVEVVGDDGAVRLRGRDRLARRPRASSRTARRRCRRCGTSGRRPCRRGAPSRRRPASAATQPCGRGRRRPTAPRTPKPRSVKLRPLRTVRPTPSSGTQRMSDVSTPPCRMKSSSSRPTSLSANAVTTAVRSPKQRRRPRATLYSPPPSHTRNERACAHAPLAGVEPEHHLAERDEVEAALVRGAEVEHAHGAAPPRRARPARRPAASTLGEVAGSPRAAAPPSSSHRRRRRRAGRGRRPRLSRVIAAGRYPTDTGERACERLQRRDSARTPRPGRT